MDCVLVRHGIAVERDEWKGADGDRPLTDRGAKRVAQVAMGLKRLDLRPDLILSSPLVRAAETAKILQEKLRVRSAIREEAALFPDAPPDVLLAILQDLPPESCVLGIGHEPHLRLVAGLLLTGKPSTAFPFKKAGACLIEVPSPVKPGTGVLRWWMGPSQLRALGKQ
jgi:phosphohistidine phosphatase